VLANELRRAERERLKMRSPIAASTMSARSWSGCRRRRCGDNGRLTPRPFVLRVFAAATPNGWTILPGGFCRIAEQPDARAVSMGDGARSADVWIVSDKAVSASTLLPAVEAVRIRRIAGVAVALPTIRSGWPHLERAEATLRLIRARNLAAIRKDRRPPPFGRAIQRPP
jgi:hypothetical protein